MAKFTQAPLSEKEIEELDNFLLEAEGIEESMDISMLDGFLTAIICGPKAIMPSEWLRWVWDTEKGEDAPEFQSQKQAERILGLIMRHMNDIAMALAYEQQYYEPLLMENPNNGDPIPILDEWCIGFMKGTSLDESGWLPLFAGHPGWASTILLYGTEEGWDILKKKDLPLDEHKALAVGLTDTVKNIHGLFFEHRKRQGATGQMSSAPRREPVRNPGKTGRNDPCPCGSGKKYKVCHGAPGRLH